MRVRASLSVLPWAWTCCFLGAFVSLGGATAWAQAASSATEEQGAAAVRDGSHDFDWDIGTWKTHQKRLLHPLTGSTTWVEYNGTDVVQKMWDGGNQGMVEADGPAGHFGMFTLRLYSPAAHQWSIYFAPKASGTLSLPVVGEFQNGRGEFYDQEDFNGRAVLVRFSISDITPKSCRFEQAFSADGGKTWETNFIVTETLMNEPASSR